ncbi:hypothetical protein [Pseudanabaena sp. PCC 6802]|uniref:hypothetical protein n=1 Tax=Pseudanabaena sp. PCC 6802 TaxID=118173 RepID=UPI000344E2FD|nr:hypothetical protein [Pseudanabaena sp. PCC 6802]
MEAFTQGDRKLADNKVNGTELPPQPEDSSKQNADTSHSKDSANPSHDRDDDNRELDSDRQVHDEGTQSSTAEATDIPADKAPEPEAPSPIAWQVWTYLERHRKDTLQCIGTFDSEWKAQRFIADAERQNRNHLRVHYEIHPLLELDEEESRNGTSDDTGDAEVITDAIDVEIMSDSGA